MRRATNPVHTWNPSFRECTNVLLLFAKHIPNRTGVLLTGFTSVGARFYYSQNGFLIVYATLSTSSITYSSAGADSPPQAKILGNSRPKRSKNTVSNGFRVYFCVLRSIQNPKKFGLRPKSRLFPPSSQICQNKGEIIQGGNNLWNWSDS